MSIISVDIIEAIAEKEKQRTTKEKQRQKGAWRTEAIVKS